jgi:dTMP kinase
VNRYFVLDGPDGCGKSSQARALCTWLQQRGQAVQHVREPGSTPVGEALRRLLLSPQTGELQPITEALLFSAARAELVSKVIAPALARGEVVIGERGYLSTVVYQGLAGGERSPAGAVQAPPVDWLFELSRRVHGECLPAAIFLLDVLPQVAAQRRATRQQDRFEARSSDYHARVRDGYLGAARLEPRARVVDASRPFQVVQDELQAVVAAMLAGAAT